MITGWYRDSSGEWYFMADDGGMCSSQWVASGAGHYYLCADGRMARECYVRSKRPTAPGRYKYYWVDEHGKWLEQWDTEEPDLTKYKLADAQLT